MRSLIESLSACRKTWQHWRMQLQKRKWFYEAWLRSKCDNGCSFRLSRRTPLHPCPSDKEGHEVMRTLNHKWLGGFARRSGLTYAPIPSGAFKRKMSDTTILLSDREQSSWTLPSAIYQGTTANWRLEAIVRKVIDDAWRSEYSNLSKSLKTRSASFYTRTISDGKDYGRGISPYGNGQIEKAISLARIGAGGKMRAALKGKQLSVFYLEV